MTAAFIKLLDGWEAPFEEAVAEVFTEQLHHCLAILEGHKSLSYERKASVNYNELSDDLSKWFTEGESEDVWRARFFPMLQGMLMDNAENQTAVLLGARFNMANFWTASRISPYMTFAQEADNTTLKVLEGLMTYSATNGESISATAKMFEQAFTIMLNGEGELAPDVREWLGDRMPFYRRELIARTELNRAANRGAMDMYGSWGVQYKAWQATGDKRTRPSHLKAWEQYGINGSPGPIPMHEAFIVGGYAMLRPGDGPPHESSNCRCAVLPVLEEHLRDRAKIQAKELST